jgi:hypothetical protein
MVGSWEGEQFEWMVSSIVKDGMSQKKVFQRHFSCPGRRGQPAFSGQAVV